MKKEKKQSAVTTKSTKMSPPPGAAQRNCKLLPIGVPVLIVAIALSFGIFQLIREPNAHEWHILLEFIAFEVPPNLYLVFAPAVFLLALGYWKELNRHFFYPLLALVSLSVFLRCVFYYFGDAQMLASLPPALVEQFDIKVCPTGQVCSPFRDLSFILWDEPDKGARIWVDDFFWLAVISIPLFFIEGSRHHFPNTALFYVIVNLIVGPDVALPLFFRTLEKAEITNPKNLRNATRYHWLYFILGVAATASWLPNLMEWVIYEGTVANQLNAGCRLPVGARATWAIMITSFSLGFNTISQINVEVPRVAVLSFIMTWLVRLFMVVLICSNVAAALSVFLIFRELVVATPSFLQPLRP
eukprot:TRINITY_DN10595_c0_g1_i1.p1 TRINITY_DN10595_c0_g1~~TRINITY_DN10595_c0_g1_i1.p1  ORF type:complete len:357 (-),score=49.43 TRINITY_DN10595_c0_g1_i1:7-1077(-)